MQPNLIKDFLLKRSLMKIFIKRLKKLDCTKASQDTDIPSSIIKENADIFANFLYFSYNKAVSDCEFPKSFKNANVLSIYTKDSRLEEKTIAPLAFSIIYRKYTRE